MAMYEISKYVTLNDMMNHLAAVIPRDFEMVEYELVDSRHREMGPTLITSNQMLTALYPDFNEIAFYVRPPSVVPRRPRLSVANILQYARITPSRRNGECMICYEEAVVTRHYGCTHTYCRGCIRGCERVNINRCAICRRQHTGSNQEIIETIIIPHSI
jgi:hypothetical protein